MNKLLLFAKSVLFKTSKLLKFVMFQEECTKKLAYSLY